MPKNKEKKALAKAEKKAAKPYDRKDKSTADTPSSSAPAAEASSSMPQPIDSPAKPSKSSRRRRKEKTQQTTADTDMKPEPEPEPIDTQNLPDSQPVVDEDVPDRKRRRAGKSAAVDGTAATTAEEPDTSLELQDALAKLRAAEDKAADTEADLKRRVEELEKQLDESKQQVVKQTDEIESQTKMITDHTKHHDAIKDGLSCGVCFEIFEDPHVLSCGHTACRKCFVQWFRSSNAYRGEDIQAVLEGDDLTYRTKICHMCREPILRRPIRMFALQSVIETLGLAPRHLDAERNEDHWALTFPPDPVSYLISDEYDAVNRCPACGCEVVGGNCEGCRASFSDEDGEFDSADDLEASEDGFDDDDDDVSGEDLPFDPAALENIRLDPAVFERIREEQEAAMAQYLNHMNGRDDDSDSDDEERPRVNRINRGRPRPRPRSPPNFNFIDAIADVSDDGEGLSGSDDSRSSGDEGHYAGRYGYDNSDNENNFSDNEAVPEDILRHGVEFNRWGSDESDDDDFRGGRRQFSPPAPRFNRGVRDRGVIDLRSASPEVRAPRRGQGARRPAVEEEEPEEDEDYESSFINDSEPEGDEMDSEAEVDASAALSAKEEEEDEPTIEELRNRRAARFAVPCSRSASPIALEAESPPRAVRPAARRNRRVISVSDSE